MAGRSLLDNIFLIYFAIHIPITLLIGTNATDLSVDFQFPNA
jgi:hypothetical protein